MDLKLANDVVYAILGSVVGIFLIVYTTRIVKLRAEERKPLPIREEIVYDHPAPANTAPWPAVSRESETRPIGK